MGTTIAARPTPKPITIRPITRTVIDLANARTKAPAMNNKSPKYMAGFQPRQSANGPPNNAPNAAPRVAILVTSY